MPAENAAARAELLSSGLALCASIASDAADQEVRAELDELGMRIHRRRVLHALAAADAGSVRHLISDELLEDLSRVTSRQAILLGSQFGSFVLALAGISRRGIRLATVVKGENPSLAGILERAGVLLIRTSDSERADATLRRLEEAQKSGYLLYCPIDAPGHSRRRYRFLDFEVSCARLPAFLIESWGMRPLFVYSRDISETVVFTGSVRSGSSRTARSVILQDERSLVRGLARLPVILDWRKGH